MCHWAPVCVRSMRKEVFSEKIPHNAHGPQTPGNVVYGWYRQKDGIVFCLHNFIFCFFGYQLIIFSLIMFIFRCIQHKSLEKT